MGGVDLKDQMFQPYLLERKKGNKWYIKIFKRLLNVAVHNTVVLFRATTGSQKLDYLSFRLALIKGLIETHGLAVYGRPSVEPPPKRLTERHFFEKIPVSGKKGQTAKVLFVLDKRSEKSSHIGAQIVKQGSFWKNVSRSIIQS
jgi:hypothetical protein